MFGIYPGEPFGSGKLEVDPIDTAASYRSQSGLVDDAYHKYPKNYDLYLLSVEFVALKVADLVARHCSFAITLPSVEIGQDSNGAFFLKKSLIDFSQRLDRAPLDLASTDHKTWLLQSLVLDLILLNTDGHKKNLVRDGKHGLICFDYDRANSQILRGKDIPTAIEKMASATKSGFAQTFIREDKMASLRQILSGVMASAVFDELDNVFSDAIKELSGKLKLDSDTLEILRDFQGACLNQAKSFQSFLQNPEARMPLFTAPTPAASKSRSVRFERAEQSTDAGANSAFRALLFEHDSRLDGGDETGSSAAESSSPRSLSFDSDSDDELPGFVPRV